MFTCTPEQEKLRVREFTKHVNCSVSETSLGLLRAVDITVDNLVMLQKQASAFTAEAETLVNELAQCAPQDVIDPDNSACDLIESVENAIEVVVEIMRKKIESAIRDPQLNGHHEDAVISEFNRTIGFSIELHDVLERMRWGIMEHDAEISKTTASFADSESTISYLKAL